MSHMNRNSTDAKGEAIKNALHSLGFSILTISEAAMVARIDEVMEFVNGIRNEFAGNYKWTSEPKEYFLKDLPGKWLYSQMITHDSKIVFVNISSVQNNVVHFHGSYGSREYRGKGLATYHMAYISSLALQDGIEEMEGYWPKHNNGSLILHLRLGWKIDDLRKNGEQLFLTCNAKETLRLCLKQLKLDL